MRDTYAQADVKRLAKVREILVHPTWGALTKVEAIEAVLELAGPGVSLMTCFTCSETYHSDEEHVCK